MSPYKFYQWVSESGSVVLEASFASDADAIAHIDSMPIGIYSIEKETIIDAGVKFTSIIYQG